MKLDHLSHSQISMLHKCGEQYRRRYIDGERVPPGVAQIRGRSVHRANERNLVAKVETGALLSLDEVQAAARDAVVGELQGEFVLDGDYAELGLERAKGFVQDEVVELATLHATEIAPKLEPKAIEVRIELPPSNALPVKLVGVLDLVDEHTGVRDTKTAQKSPGADDADLSDQLTAYDLLHRAYYREPPKGLGLDVLVRTPKKGDVKVVSLSTTRSVADLGVYVRRAQAAVRMIEAEIFLPAAQDSWACSAKWCGYSATCLFFRGRPRPQS